ncbi:MAG: metallophosphoesterase [Ruminococcus sp.]|nr:metallophosphoesterase [Ruminococcus sp.]
MTIFNIVLWFILTATVYGGLFAVWIPLRKKDKIWISIAGIVAEIILACICAYFDIVSVSLLPRFLYCFLALLYTALLADAAAEIVFLIIRILRKRAAKTIVRLVAGMVAALLFLSYMVVNSQVVVPNYHTYKSSKLIRDHKIIYLSDLHYGHTQTKETVEQTFKNIKNEKPELLLLGGDITDEFTSKEDMEYIYNLIGSLGIPTYFDYGNHDRQNHSYEIGGRTYSDSELENALKSNGITALRDEYTELGDLVILGREDYDCDRRIPVEKLKPRPSDKYVINLDHSPYQYDDISASGADLQLSGHVHAAQLFPLRLIYTFAVDNIYGDYRSGNTDIYVSSGVSGWCFPLRSEAHCNYEVITLKKG